jgi:hypothetical protein
MHSLNSSPSTLLSTAGLSWYINNAANIISTKIAKTNFSGTDCGEMLIGFVMNW